MPERVSFSNLDRDILRRIGGQARNRVLTSRRHDNPNPLIYLNREIDSYMRPLIDNSPLSTVTADFLAQYFDSYQQAFGVVRITADELARSEDTLRKLVANMSEEEAQKILKQYFEQLREIDIRMSPKLELFWVGFDALNANIRDNYGPDWAADTTYPVLRMQQILHGNRALSRPQHIGG